MWLLLEQVSTPKTLQNSDILEPLHFLSLSEPVPRGSRACMSYDCRHAANVCVGSVQSRTNVRPALTSQHLLLQVQMRVFLTPRHKKSHGVNVGNGYADHAAAFGPLGLVSSHIVSKRWPHPCFNTTNLIRGCSDLVDNPTPAT